MGLVFSPSESQGLVNALRSNLATAETMIEQLNQASKRLIDALNGHTLSGAAYTAGKGLFSEMVLPTISKASESLQQLKSKLNQYESYAGAAGGEFLDEDKLNQQLELLRAQQASLTSQINYYRMMSISCPENAELNMMYSNFQSQLSNYLSTTANDIQRVQDKLKRLHEFNSNVSPLFSYCLEEFKRITKIVVVLSNANFDSGGKAILNIKNNKEVKEFFKDFGIEITNAKSWLDESTGAALDKAKDIIVNQGKNIGKSLGAKLQPRSSLGTFVKDEFGPRRWLSGKLKSISNPANKMIGNVVTWGGRSLIALGAVQNFNDYDLEYHNKGRAFVYGSAVTLASWGAGVVGSAVGGVAASAFAGTVLASSATVALPIVGAVAVGAAVAVGTKKLYKHCKPFKNIVDGVGDKINNIGKTISSPLKSLKGAFR